MGFNQLCICSTTPLLTEFDKPSIIHNMAQLWDLQAQNAFNKHIRLINVKPIRKHIEILSLYMSTYNSVRPCQKQAHIVNDSLTNTCFDSSKAFISDFNFSCSCSKPPIISLSWSFVVLRAWICSSFSSSLSLALVFKLCSLAIIWSLASVRQFICSFKSCKNKIVRT